MLPYVPRYFEALSKILRNVGILVSSKPHLTLKDMLPKAKDSVESRDVEAVIFQSLPLPLPHLSLPLPLPLSKKDC